MPTSTNMQLTIPSVGVTAGPEYATDINSALTLIDQHDHTPGRGVQITPAGININASLDFNDNAALALTKIVFTEQSVATSTLQALSVAPGSEGPPLQDLWYTDSAGNKVQITSGGQLAPVSATVSGITYSTGSFFFKETQSALPTTPADLDAGSVTIRPNAALTALGVRLTPPSAIASQYDIALPLLPASEKVLTINASGVMAASSYTFPLPQAALGANSVGTSQIIDSNVTTAKINDTAVTFAKLAPLNILSATSTLRNVGTTGPAYFSVLGNNVTLTPGTWRLTGMGYWEGPNPADLIEVSWYGAPGVDNNVEPAALTCTVLGGRIGRSAGPSTSAGTQWLIVAQPACECIVSVTVNTLVYLVQHGRSTGTNMTIQCVLTAEQLR